MKRLFSALIAISLAVPACVPARLERLTARRSAVHTEEADLSRAFSGSSDSAAMDALARWIEKVHREGSSGGPVREGGFLVHFHPAGRDIFAPGYFDKLEPTDRYGVSGLQDHRLEGAGVPMAGYRENKGRLPVEKWYPPEGITRAVTAVAIPGGQRDGLRLVEIRLYDRMKTETALIGGKRETLAADFTVPWVALLANSRGLATSGVTSLVSQKAAREPGFYLMEEYDPHRTPLILIHGLLLTPLTWAGLTNDLWADPGVRQRYQIWQYLYPTNAPPLYSARIMRGQLDELRRFLDPGQGDPAMRRSVVVGHSMGGLLAKSLVVDPRAALWDAVFKRPMSQMNLTAEERSALREEFFWKPRRYVDRVIFCSVPFGGSTLAGSWVGKLGKHLVAPTPGFSELFDGIARKNPDAFQPPYDHLSGDQINSLVDLDPKQRALKIFRGLPIIPGTASHVIKGANDRVVSSASADVPGAESTLSVPSGHGTFRKLENTAEILRILALPPHH